MSGSISSNTEAILLLTAPLIVGRKGSYPGLLSLGEYNRLARILRDAGHEPSDLLLPGVEELIARFQGVIDGARLRQLLGRGFLLSQAAEKWQSRAIWVISRADTEYPVRLKLRLKDAAPPILYGCGDNTLLEAGSLAIVGSRHVDDMLVAYAENIGRLAAHARVTVVSGGARGIDQAAMRGALLAGGQVVGMLSDNLERAVLVREHREFLMEGRLVLTSPYDPAAGFDVGNAMNRNKLVYGLADVALVASADYQTGGTWAGAREQLEKLHLVPVYVRSSGGAQKGLDGLRRMGALPWPNPETADALSALVSEGDRGKRYGKQEELPLSIGDKVTLACGIHQVPPPNAIVHAVLPDKPILQTAADELFAKVRQLLLRLNEPKTADEIAVELQVSKGQAKIWLQRLVKEGAMSKKQKPLRYVASVTTQAGLFGSPK